jgi:hypothetical protein
VDRNADATGRTGTLTIAGQSLTVVQAGRLPDTVGDGTPDAWKTNYFTSTSDTNAAAGADPDGDGVNNGDEYLAGTIPTDPGSVPELDLQGVTGAGAELVMATTSGRLYRIERTQDLASEYWFGFTSAVIGTGTVENVLDVQTADRWFYRMRISR